MKNNTIIRYPATSLLLAITTLVFIAMCIMRMGHYTETQTIYDFGGLYGLTLQSNPIAIWRLVTPIFVHIGLEHFILNALTLYFIGREAEAIFGSIRFVILYLLSGILGNAFVLYFTPTVLAAGASTSLFGLFSAIVVLRYFVSDNRIHLLSRQFLLLLLLNLLFGLITPNISMVGHIGGLLGGVLLAIALDLPKKQTKIMVWQRLLAGFLFLLVLLVLITKGIMG